MELLDLEEDCPWAVHKKTLQKVVAAYPALCETFFPHGLEAAGGGFGGQVDRKYGGLRNRMPWTT